MKKKEKNKNVVNQWGNGNDVIQTLWEFETLLRNDKNIFFVAFIQRGKPDFDGRSFLFPAIEESRDFFRLILTRFVICAIMWWTRE